MAPITPAQVSAAKQTACALVQASLPEFAHTFKYSHSEGNFYSASENLDWTPGFWTGQLWLAWEATHAQPLRDAAAWQVHSFWERICNHVEVDHHDMGFLYSPSCVAAYKLTGSEEGKAAALLAADQLAGRFQKKGGFLQAWGKLGAPDNYRLIIDCLLNLPLLYWASEVSGKPHYAEIANQHIHTALNHVLRADDSTYHTYFFDPATGAPLRGVTAQGYCDGSAWARGQAWGVYGTALAYRYTRRPAYIETFCRITDFFLAKLPQDLVPYWDFTFGDGSTEPRDSSASAVAACGMLEMAQYLDGARAAYYTDAAKKLMAALLQHCAVQNTQQSNGLLLHGTYARDSQFNTCQNRGVDECNIWGDYYYLEALTRLSTGWHPYW
ncbi:MAG: glycoside hydrolase family 88 protein [Gemmiger sp.]|nr:glycoside hydrolase family 88 protein [Gemmiger sp.]